VRSTVTLSNCVFQSNTFDDFLGGDDYITFTKHMFDIQWIDPTGNVSFATKNCVYNTQITLSGLCKLLPSRLLDGAIAGIAIGGLKFKHFFSRHRKSNMKSISIIVCFLMGTFTRNESHIHTGRPFQSRRKSMRKATMKHFLFGTSHAKLVLSF
jgi:hypothetical protein